MLRIHRSAAIAGALTFGLVGGLASPAVASPATASNWHVGVYTPSGRALSEAQAARPAVGLASFHFTTTPDTALLIATQGSQKGALLGDISGKTVTATYTISGTGFTYYGEGSSGCTAQPSARLFFETSNAGGFDETNYWWSNPESAVLANGTMTLTTTVAGADWSDYYGHFGTGAYSAGFAAAAGHVTGIGLSFGGGCFFENGVGAPDATLTLTGFSVGPMP